MSLLSNARSTFQSLPTHKIHKRNILPHIQEQDSRPTNPDGSQWWMVPSLVILILCVLSTKAPQQRGFAWAKPGAGQSLSGPRTVRGSNSGERGKGCVATSHGGHEGNCGNPTTPTHKKITAASECSPYSRHSGLSTLSYLLLVTAHPEAAGHTPPANSWFSSFPTPRPAPCQRVRRKSWYVTFTLLSLLYIPVLSEERRTRQMKEICLPILTRNMTRT